MRKRLYILIFILVGFAPLPAQVQRGKATFYSKRATGARTASGERLHHDSLTCAHRTFPFGSLLKVRNLSNGREVVVRVTDRGPFARGRIIDLSYGAAEELGIIGQGVAMVEVQKVGQINVPYRNDQRIELPEMDFEVSQAGYSLMDQWKKAPQKKETKSQQPQQKKPQQPQPKKAAKAAEKENPIRNIFKKIRNWGN